MSMNKVNLMGNLTIDPELKESNSGVKYCHFVLITKDEWTGKDGEKKERTDYHRIVVWGKLAESCKKHLRNGSRALVEGSIHTRSWEDNGEKKYITEIHANSIHSLNDDERFELPKSEPKQAPVQKSYPQQQNANRGKPSYSHKASQY